MLCLLPCVEPSDVTLQIHVTLIQAFCWENDIRILKVSIRVIEILIECLNDWLMSGVRTYVCEIASQIQQVSMTTEIVAVCTGSLIYLRPGTV